MFQLTPWHKRTGSDLVGFKKEIDNLFSRFFELDFPSAHEFFKEGGWTPKIDISDSETHFLVKAEIPGCNVSDIDISLERRMLTIKGQKKQDKEEKAENQLKVERVHGFFSRTLELPADVDPESVEASYKKGVLTVNLKKIAPSESKKIHIKTS